MSDNPDIKHLAHDLNNIFNRILGSIDALKIRLSDTEEVSSLLNNIEASTYLASEIIQDSIIGDEHLKKVRRVSINALIKDIVNSTVIPNNKFKFVLDLDQNLPPVIGKYSDFYRLLLNLITNSIEAINSKGCISISTGNTGLEKNIEIIIKDNGRGIDESSLSLIFNESYSTKREYSGFGLSIVKKIIESYNGSIDVESSVDSGSTFKIKLPAAKKIELKHNSTGKSILVAEDETVLRELLVDLLQSYGYNVIPASNGKELLSSFEKCTHLDLLIIDNIMPDIEGTACLKEIEKTKREIPFILASGSQIESGYNFSTKKFRIINKPYNFEELLVHIEELIG